jgi:hypothetical protein
MARPVVSHPWRRAAVAVRARKPPQQSAPRCIVCRRVAFFLCDGPGEHPGGRCDTPLCGAHRYRPNPRQPADFCPRHRAYGARVHGGQPGHRPGAEGA